MSEQGKTLYIEVEASKEGKRTLHTCSVYSDPERKNLIKTFHCEAIIFEGCCGRSPDDFKYIMGGCEAISNHGYEYNLDLKDIET